MLLPACVQEWVPDNDLAHFVIDAVATLPMFGLCAIDLKSTQDSSPGAIEKSIYQWGYHRQAVWYRRALRAVGMNAQAFALMFVEKTPPYVVTAANVAEAAQAVVHRYRIA